MPNAEYTFTCVDCKKKISMATEKPRTARQLHQLLLDREWLPLDVAKKTGQCPKCQKKAADAAAEGEAKHG